MLTGGGDESGAERMAAAVEEVAEPFALFVVHPAEPEPPDAVGPNFKVAEISAVFQGGRIEADEVAAGRSAAVDAFVVVGEVTAAVEDQFAAMHLGGERMVRGMPVHEIGGTGLDELVSDAAMESRHRADPVPAPVKRHDDDITLASPRTDVGDGGGQSDIARPQLVDSGFDQLRRTRVRHDLVDAATRHDIAGEKQFGAHAEHLWSRGTVPLRYGEKDPRKAGPWRKSCRR